MFTYAVESFNYFVQAFEGVYIWTDDKENRGKLNRLFTSYNGEMPARQKPISEMTCASYQRDALVLESNDAANLPFFIQNFQNPLTIKTIKIINDSSNPILVGMPEFLDILDTFQNLSSLYVDNCQSIFEAESSIIVCEKMTTLSLTNLFNLNIEGLKLIAKFFPNLKTLMFNKCSSINHIDDTLELMIDLFPKTEIIMIEDTTYILDRA